MKFNCCDVVCAGYVDIGLHSCACIKQREKTFQEQKKMSNPIDFANMSEESLNNLLTQITTERDKKQKARENPPEVWEVHYHFKTMGGTGRSCGEYTGHTFTSIEKAAEAIKKQLQRFEGWWRGYFPKKIS